MEAIKRLLTRFMSLTMLMKIIIINAVVFVGLYLAVIIAVASGGSEFTVLQWVEMPASLTQLAVRPWTVLSYMFAQYEVMHILFNMLWLYWFGVLFQDICGGRTLLRLYLLGGFAGAIFFLIAGNLPIGNDLNHSWLIGSSAGVIAIVAATAIIMPEFRFNLLFLGPVALKWIAIVTIGLDLIGGVTGSNVGGHIAHLGGAVAGAAFALARRKGTDITRPIESVMSFFSRLGSVKPTRKSSGPRTESKADIERDRARLDEILEKIKHSGYSALTLEERRLLFEISNREKNR